MKKPVIRLSDALCREGRLSNLRGLTPPRRASCSCELQAALQRQGWTRWLLGLCPLSARSVQLLPSVAERGSPALRALGGAGPTAPPGSREAGKSRQHSGVWGTLTFTHTTQRLSLGCLISPTIPWVSPNVTWAVMSGRGFSHLEAQAGTGDRPGVTQGVWWPGGWQEKAFLKRNCKTISEKQRKQEPEWRNKKTLVFGEREKTSWW